MVFEVTTAVKVYIVVFWVMTAYPVDGGGFLRNVGSHVRTRIKYKYIQEATVEFSDTGRLAVMCFTAITGHSTRVNLSDDIF
jgi:hypothetical protein